ncbi:hypothetical protein GGS26DRAFT_413406 [Hypomontagnella submonticulosa]|nr:hypothetical protein GGS26DRAFT_413406 [Hypomontagnella submonticulosa]
MMPVDYVPISQVGSEIDEKDTSLPVQRVHSSMRHRCGLLLVVITLLTSLRRNKPTEILSSSDFDSTNRTVQNAAWSHVDVEPWNGFVALDEDYTIAQGLPHSQRWPWDLSKGVYIMTSSHELHCVHVLRDLVNEDHD